MTCTKEEARNIIDQYKWSVPPRRQADLLGKGGGKAKSTRRPNAASESSDHFAALMHSTAFDGWYR